MNRTFNINCIRADPQAAICELPMSSAAGALPNYYWLAQSGGQTTFLASPDDRGPTFFGPGLGLTVDFFSSGDVVGDPTIDTVWTILTPGIYTVEFILSVEPNGLGLPLANPAFLVLFPLVNGVQLNPGGVAHTGSGFNQPTAMQYVTTMVFKFAHQYSAGDTFALRFVWDNFNSTVSTRSVQWERLDK